MSNSAEDGQIMIKNPFAFVLGAATVKIYG
jgi:hypothetical protein